MPLHQGSRMSRGGGRVEKVSLDVAYRGPLGRGALEERESPEAAQEGS